MSLIRGLKYIYFGLYGTIGHRPLRGRCPKRGSRQPLPHPRCFLVNLFIQSQPPTSYFFQKIAFSYQNGSDTSAQPRRRNPILYSFCFAPFHFLVSRFRFALVLFLLLFRQSLDSLRVALCLSVSAFLIAFLSV